MRHRFACLPLLLGFLASPATQAQNTIVTFDNGWENWTTGDTDHIEPDGGNPGANVHFDLLNTGIRILTDANTAFLGDFGEYGAITFSIDVKVDSITDGSGNPAPAELIADFRSHSLNGDPFASAWFNLALLESGKEWATYAVTFNPSSPILPVGWNGVGNTTGDGLPEGVSFADVMANVEELVISTFKPGVFYSFKNFDVRFDNIRIERSESKPPVPRYEIVDVGDFGGELANAFDINDKGEIVGSAENVSLTSLPFLRRRNGELIYLGSVNPNMPFAGGWAQGISENGYVVGTTSSPQSGSEAFFWSEEKGMISLDPNSTISSIASDVNSSGQVVGQLSGPNGGAFLWTENEGLRMISLPNAPAGYSNTAEGVNESGQVCGHQWNTTSTQAGWIYDTNTDTIRELTGLGSVSQTRGINDAGYVVGLSIGPNNQMRPVLWTDTGALVDLDFLPIPDFTQGKAYAINNSNWVVGSDSYDGNGALDKGWLWIEGHKVELLSLIDDPEQLAAWTHLSFPFGINNRGEIVGVGVRDDLQGRGFLMRPISDTSDAIFMNGFENGHSTR